VILKQEFLYCAGGAILEDFCNRNSSTGRDTGFKNISPSRRVYVRGKEWI
jgi:hypothetical protein